MMLMVMVFQEFWLVMKEKEYLGIIIFHFSISRFLRLSSILNFCMFLIIFIFDLCFPFFNSPFAFFISLLNILFIHFLYFNISKLS